MSAAATTEPVGGTGLVLPPGEGPMRKLATLRRAEAWRLLKAHASTGDLRVARPLAELARRAPDDAVDVLVDPTAAVLARCGR
ncbi:MAG: hypothetical protein M3Y87_22365, partial [Myxococcota bacterium]|nr:hypothetical protein [Myxococcota bacterium]